MDGSGWRVAHPKQGRKSAGEERQAFSPSRTVAPSPEMVMRACIRV